MSSPKEAALKFFHHTTPHLTCRSGQKGIQSGQRGQGRHDRSIFLLVNAWVIFWMGYFNQLNFLDELMENLTDRKT